MQRVSSGDDFLPFELLCDRWFSSAFFEKKRLNGDGVLLYGDVDGDVDGDAPGDPVDLRPGDDEPPPLVPAMGTGDVHGDGEVLTPLQVLCWYAATAATVDALLAGMLLTFNGVKEPEEILELLLLFHALELFLLLELEVLALSPLDLLPLLDGLFISLFPFDALPFDGEHNRLHGSLSHSC